MKLKEVLDKTTQFFKDKKIESARLDTELLLSHGLKIPRIQLYVKFDQPLSDEELATCRELVRRRAQGEPVAYILGNKEFFGLNFNVNSAVLIPRPETEHIVENALAWAKTHSKPLVIVDLGTGSGCIGLSLLKNLPENTRLIAVDLSQEALLVAEGNADKLGVRERMHFVNRDAGNVDVVLKSIKDFTGQSQIDILVANPPYIADNDPMVEENVKKFEPSSALFAPEDGLQFLKNWSKKYSAFLNHEAIVLMEMGMTQGAEMQKHFTGLGVFQKVKVVKDLAGLDRIIQGEKNG